MPRLFTRSPFFGYSRTELAGLRKFAHASIAWERACAEEDVHLFPVPRLVIGREGRISDMRLSDEFESRALRRLMLLPNADAIYDARRVEFMRNYNKAAYQTYMLRQEVAELHATIAAAAAPEDTDVRA